MVFLPLTPFVCVWHVQAGQVSGTTRTHGGGRRGAATMHQDQLPPVSFQASGASSHPTPLPPTTVRSTHQCAATSQRVASHDVSNRGGGCGGGVLFMLLLTSSLMMLRTLRVMWRFCCFCCCLLASSIAKMWCLRSRESLEVLAADNVGR